MNRWVAPLDLDVVLQSPYWIHKGPTVDDSIDQNVQWSIDELSLFGEQIFNAYVKKIVRGCKARNYTVPKNTYFPEVILRVTSKLECF